LWDAWKKPEPPHDAVRSTTMVITKPNKFVAQYHDSMPVLLTRETTMDWLNRAKGEELLKSSAEDALKVWPASRVVNSSKVPDAPRLTKQITI